ncbi:MAG: hypothetical protein WBF35_05420 [Candidatus Acidiferrales bacterium]
MSKLRLRTFVILCVAMPLIATARAQQSPTPPVSSSRPPSQSSAPPAAPSASAPSTAPDADFFATADEVLAEMSKLLSMPILHPVKKSLRSREQIRAYLLAEEKKEKDSAKDYADQRTLEMFGLLPKDFPLEKTLNDILTEQIAGLYDPDSQEFFISDWTSPAELKMIMAHELTHALQDQHYHIDAWRDAAKPNDDAELARDAVLEGAAVAAMLDYMLRDQGKGVRDLPSIDPSLVVGDAADSPLLSKAPMVLRDELLFPYLAGMSFTQAILKATNGWPDFGRVFANPPASTQQIMHPELYLSGVTRAPVVLPDFSALLPVEWKKLDENLMGEFGLQEVLKQFLKEPQALSIAPTWAGDRYAIFENQQTKRDLLVFRLRLTSDADAAQFFDYYSDVLEAKDSTRTNLYRRPNFFSFDTPAGGVFLRCAGSECLSAEGTTREVFDRISKAIGWPALGTAPLPVDSAPTRITFVPPITAPSSSSVAASVR